MKSNVVYIHYGTDTFRPELVSKSDERVIYNKPDKGIWASRVDADYGWKQWCEDADYLDSTDFTKSIKFTVSEDARILKVRSDKDILSYVIPREEEYRFFYGGCKTDICDKLDREKLYRDYDGIEVFMSKNYPNLHNSIFNSWDCDSLVIWNPDMIEVLR